MLQECRIIITELTWHCAVGCLLVLGGAQTTKDWYFRTSCYSDRPKTKMLVRFMLRTRMNIILFYLSDVSYTSGGSERVGAF